MPASVGWTLGKYSSAPAHRESEVVKHAEREKAAGRRARCTLSASYGAAGDGAPIFSGPEEVVRWIARHLTAERDGAVLGRQNSLGIHLHHQGGRGYRGQRSEHQITSALTLRAVLIFSPSYERHFTLSWGLPTYPGAQLKD